MKLKSHFIKKKKKQTKIKRKQKHSKTQLDEKKLAFS